MTTAKVIKKGVQDMKKEFGMNLPGSTKENVEVIDHVLKNLGLTTPDDVYAAAKLSVMGLMMVPDGENKEKALMEYLTESKEELRGRMRPYEWRPKQLRRMEEKAAQLSRMAFDVYSCDEEGKNLNPVMITAARKLMDEIKEEGRRIRLWGYPLRSKENIIKDRNFIRDEASKDFLVIYGEREKFSEAMSWKIGREVFYKGLGKAA